MGKTFFELADEAMAQAHAVSVGEALQERQDNPNTLLVDVRDAEEVDATGLGVWAIKAPGRSLAWKGCLVVYEEYRELELQDHSRRILSTCGSFPCYRGASAANLLTKMGFTNVTCVEGGMAALLEIRLATEH